MRIGVPLIGLLAALALVASGCGAASKASVEVAAKIPPRVTGCEGAVRSGWQRLAHRIDAPVFCPGWLPDPFTGKLHDGQWNTIYSVSPDRSYLMGFIWLEPGSGEVHVNLRGYPGRTKVPTCIDTEITGGKTTRTKVPCFDDSHGQHTIGGRTVTIYTRNRDADLWHVLYAWHYKGGLYTASEHVTAPLTYAKVVANLDHIMRRLTILQPTASS